MKLTNMLMIDLIKIQQELKNCNDRYANLYQFFVIIFMS